MERDAEERMTELTDSIHSLFRGYVNAANAHTLEQQLQKSKQREAVLLKEIEGAYAYLKATYDIHTWKDEPEYQMMKSFEQVLEKYKELEK